MKHWNGAYSDCSLILVVVLLVVLMWRDSEQASPQDVPQWYADYPDLKATESLRAQEKLLPQPLTI